MRVLGYAASAGTVLMLTACGAAVAQDSSGHLVAHHGPVAAIQKNGTGVVVGKFQRVGGPLGPDGQQPPIVPLSGTLRFGVSAKHWTDVQVSPSGRFTVSLPAGTYSVRGRTPSIEEQLPSGQLLDGWCTPAVSVTVEAGQTAQITMTCNVP